MVSEVAKSYMTKAEKVASLVKLGIHPSETETILSIYGGNGTTFTFGVEMECLVNWSKVIANTRDTNITFEARGYTHENSRKVFKFVPDGSLSGENNIECVSPVLENNEDGLKILKEACKALNWENSKVNKSCGLHVHIGASNLTDEQYANVFANYAMLEDVIDTFMAESRRNSRWCATLRGRGLENAYTKEDVQRCFIGRVATRTDWRGNGRYYKVNCMSWFGHQTIEFRQHGGTTNYTKISNWVKFCAALVEFSMNTRLTSKVNTIDEIPFLEKEQKDFFKKRQQELA